MIDGRLIRHWRHMHGYTAQDLAKMIGVSATSIKEWELGKRHPSPENEAKLRALMYPTKQKKKEKEKEK